MKAEVDGNWCKGCEKNCCDHFVLSNWPEWKINELIERFAFLKVYEHWVNEEETEHTWVMECERLQNNGECLDYPNGRPYFCKWAGTRYQPVAGYRLLKRRLKEIQTGVIE